MTGSQFPGQIGALSAHAPGTAERVNDAVPITAGVLAILGVLCAGPRESLGRSGSATITRSASTSGFWRSVVVIILAFRPVTERWCEQGYAQPHPPQHPYAQRPYPPVPAPPHRKETP